MNKNYILGIIFLISIASAFCIPSFGVQSIGEDIQLLTHTQYSDGVRIYVCPNSWPIYNIQIGSSVKNFMTFGSRCVWADIRGNDGLGAPYFASAGEVVKVYGYDPNNDAFKSNLKTTTMYKADASVNSPEASTVSCTARKCDVTLNKPFPTADHYTLRVYDIYGNQIYLKNNLPDVLDYNYGLTGKVAVDLPGYNTPYVFTITAYNFAETINHQQAVYKETGTCLAPAFNLKTTQLGTSASVAVVGNSLSYSGYQWTLERYYSGSWNIIDYGTSSNAKIALSGLENSASYRINVKGVNPCANGYSASTSFTTSPATNNFTLSYTSNTTSINVSLTPNVSTSYTWTLYDTDLTQLQQNTTTPPYIIYDGLTVNKLYLVTVNISGASGSIYVSRNQTASNIMNITSYDHTMTSINVRFQFFNSTGSPASMIGVNQFIINALNGTESVNESIVDGSINNSFYDMTINSLTPAKNYTVTGTITFYNGQSMSSSINVVTDAANYSDWTMNSDIYGNSGEDYKNNLRQDVDIQLDFVTDTTPFTKLNYTLYDVTGSYFAISNNSFVNISNGRLVVYHLLPDRLYMISAIPYLGSQAWTAKNLTFSYNKMVSFECAGQSYPLDFDTSFIFSGSQLQAKTTLSSYPSSVDAKTDWSFNVYENDNSSAILIKLLSGNIIDSYSGLGSIDSTYDTLRVYVYRTVTCISNNNEVYGQGKMFSFQQNELVSQQFGAIQFIYDGFDSLFPSDMAKFGAVMGVSVVISIVAFILTIGSGYFNWAVAMAPLVLGFTIALVFGFVPFSIFMSAGFLALIGAVYLAIKVFSGA